tara:strand:+ start:1609 stop:1794 length:186 start_codon:yes stop_codon:yes gene_type:complete
MPVNNKTAQDIHGLLEIFAEDIKSYFQSEVPYEDWEDDILTKTEELLEESSVLLGETKTTY